MFGKAITLGKVAGFAIRVDLSWLIILALIIWSLGWGVFPQEVPHQAWVAYVAMAVAAALAFFASIVVHELSHSLMARRFGLPMKGITLFIFGGMAEMSDEPPNAKAEFWIAVVGPLTSLAIAGASYAAALAGRWAGAPAAILAVLNWTGYMNVLLAVFNLIPGFPLDGGRVLRAILWYFQHSLRKATAIASQIGGAFGLALTGLGVLTIFLTPGGLLAGVWWVLIGIFLRSAARREYQGMLFRDVFHGEPVRRFMNSNPVAVDPSVSLKDLVENYIYKYHYKMFPVAHDGRVDGCVGIGDVQGLPPEEWPRHTVGEVAARCSESNSISPSADVMTALDQMNRTGTSRLIVAEDGRLAGIVSLKDLLRFLSLKLQLGDQKAAEEAGSQPR
jgi:Zn-dependent protease